MRIAIVGSGPGGYVAAIKAAQLGARVTVIEDDEVGGTCLNWGCIPTKTMIGSCELLAKVRELEKFGMQLKGEVVASLPMIMERKDKVVGIQVKGIKGLFKSWGIDLRSGRGVLTSPTSIEVKTKNGDSETVEADKIIIATGSRPASIPVLPFDGERILSSSDALRLREIPESLIIIGAGVIGSEFACIYRELGTEITMVEMMSRAVNTEDEEISELLEREFKKKKIRLLTGIKLEEVEVKADGVHALLSDGKEVTAEKVLVSIGRAFNSENMGLETVGVKKGEKGNILVNARMETNIPGIYAVGDVTGGMLLAHVASAEGIVAVKNALGQECEMDYSVVPAAIFTSPQIAAVGLREHQAAEKGIAYRTGHFQFRALGKAHAIGEISGFIKFISEEETDKVLGVHIIGAHASDLIHEAAVAMRAGLTTRDIAATIHTHPTLSEGIREAAEDVHGEAIHVLRK
jgi:dihydrolipoamide dehydrogenase